MTRLTTLGEFIIKNQADFPYPKGELNRLMSSIKLASKVMNSQINKAGLVDDIIGNVGRENVQGEIQKKLDVYANELFINALKARNEVCGIASEEVEKTVIFENEEGKNGKYVISIDPIDGSSNIEVNVSIGTVFAIYRRVTPIGTPAQQADFLQPGRQQLVAGYVIFGSSTMLKASNRPYTARYIGSMIADLHRIFLKGGIYIYPNSSKAKNGKLRLLYECNPMAFLMEQAGGKASDGQNAILDIQPEEIHQRVPFFIGSKKMVEKAEEILAATNPQTSPLP